MREIRFGLLFAILCLLTTALQAAPITIAGQVLGPDGKPVVGAQVMTLQSEGPGFRSVQFITDAEGKFTLQTEPFPMMGGLPVVARKAGLAMAFGQAKPGTFLTLKLGDKPETRSGVVLDPQGKPVANASVVADRVIWAASADASTGLGVDLMGVELKVVTDATGRFSFDGFAPDLALMASLQVEGCANTVITIPSSVPVTTTLKPEATISGKILVAGQPRADITVWSYMQSAPPSSARTGADRTYTLRHLGAGSVIVSANTVAGMAQAADQRVTVHAGQAVTGIDFILSPGAVIRGTVTDARTGQPVAKAYVQAVTAVSAQPGTMGGPSGRQTDAAGKYELRVSPGTYQVQCSGPVGSGVMMRPLPPPVPGAQDVLTVKEGDVIEGRDLAIKLPRTVQGQVLRPDGQPATGAKLMAFSGVLNAPWIELKPEARFELAVADPPTPGTREYYQPGLTLLVTEPDKNLAAFVNLEILGDTLTVALQPAATVTALVTDMQNQPLKGFGLSVGYPEGEHGWASQGMVLSDERGMISLPCLPAGTKLRFFAAGDMMYLVASDALRNLDLTLTPGEQRQLPTTVVNPAGRSLNVFVGDAAGQAVKGAQVYASGSRTPALTDEQGKVTLTKLPLKGKVMLLAIHPSQDWYAADYIDPDAGVWPGLIVKPLGKASGVLIAKAGGKPLEGVPVSCEATGEFWQLDQEVLRRTGLTGLNQQRSATDAEGRWHLGNLLPGMDYMVLAQTPGGGCVEAGSFEAEGGPDEQDTGAVECDVAPPAPLPAPGAPGVPAGAAPMPPPPAPPAR